MANRCNNQLDILCTGLRLTVGDHMTPTWHAQACRLIAQMLHVGHDHSYSDGMF